MKEHEDFFRMVYEVVKLIPEGRVTTYGSIASYLGTKSSSRMVGWAMNKAPSGIPAHRVVNRNGMLTGKHHFGSPKMMEELLKNEGLTIKKDTIIGFEKVFWDPGIKLYIL